MELLNFVLALIDKTRNELSPAELSFAELHYNNNDCQVLAQSSAKFEFLLSPDCPQSEISIFIDTDDQENFVVSPSTKKWDRYSFACLMQMAYELHLLGSTEPAAHKQYSREGMVKRVLDERRQKALSAQYRIKWADNIYGDHLLTNENGIYYKIFLRDFQDETGYSDSKDSAVNKLGTTKHIMFAFNALKNDKSLFNRLSKTCPFVEIFLDPLNEYRISYFYPHSPSRETGLFISKYFGNKTYIDDEQTASFVDFITEAQFFSNIVIRPEVKEKIELTWERKSLESLQRNFKPDFGSIKADLFDYQKKGIAFAVCRKHAIIADEMGLGKTVQAIGTALLKKEVFGFRKTLIVCPASLKSQWKKEIEKFTGEKALIVDGFPDERALAYKNANAYFLIINYETVLRDQIELNKAKIDFLILDEAQKVKNYATKTASAIKNVGRKHVLIITGTPIENKLIDLFSIMTILDPHFLGPLWEFSYQYCLFDHEKHNKINGYYNLTNLKERLKPILLRREKRKVIEQLPNVRQHDVPVGMTNLQKEYHAGYAASIARIISKKYLTAFDMQRLQQLLTSMRMVCDSTYLVDGQTFDSPKLEELKYILLEKLDLQNSSRKVIIFSEWVKVHKLIGQMLRENNIGFTELNGKVPVSKRGELIKRFETSAECKVFLSTEAGGSGLNLQVADSLINFELPWNPAKKNQRIGRIDRLGQKSSNLIIFNLITFNSIEERIAQGLLIKQNLFESVLNEEGNCEFVDFSEKGRSQFLQQVQQIVSEFDNEFSGQADSGLEPPAEEKNSQPGQEANVLPEELFGDDTIEEDGVMAQESTEEAPKPADSKVLPPTQQPAAIKAEQMEQVMNSGMQFLSGLFQMATGQSKGIEGQKIEINRETGEVTMKFKLPVV
ncbi:MAG: DEAD/DEAH box helicase [Bacteroidales bacterium]|nr:DEAD/DEAH box helicase [Bacteroidales bacterium]